MKETPHNVLPKFEDEITEFKTSFGDEVIETLVAFANTRGGTVYIGVSDDRRIKGVNPGKETLQKWLNEIKNKTQPAIIPSLKVLLIHEKNVVQIQVQSFPVKPLSFKGRYYKRTDSANHLLSASEITDMNLQSLQLS
jgi:ATP-dependent DNA helicase RecG